MLKRILLSLVLLAALASTAMAATSQYVAVVVGSSSTSVLAANDIGSFRHGLYLFNNSSVPAYCAMNTSNAATTANGIYVAPLSGQTFGMSYSAFSVSGPTTQFPAFDIACISSGNGTNIIAFDY